MFLKVFKEISKFLVVEMYFDFEGILVYIFM